MILGRVALPLLLAAFSVSCSDAAPTAEPTSTTIPAAPATTAGIPVTTTVPVPTTTPVPTTSTASESQIACPRPGPPLLTVDNDVVTMEERPGGQLLVVCDGAEGRSLDLGYGVWYLGVAGHGNGAGELMLGAPRIEDVVESDPQWRSVIEVEGALQRSAPLFEPSVGGVVRVAPSSGICDDVEGGRYSVDLDGDGADDIFAQRFNRDPLTMTGPALVVCTAAGVVDEILVGGMGEVFNLGNPTGESWILWGGGTSASHAFWDPFAFDDGRIRPVEDVDGRLFFTSGQAFGSAELFSCGDLDGDGAAEIIQLVGVRDGEVVEWTRESWEIDGVVATKRSAERGQVIVPEEIEYFLFGEPNAFTDLMPDGDCGPADELYERAG